MLCCGDNYYGLFIFTVDSRLEVEGCSSRMCSYQSKGKLSRKHSFGSPGHAFKGKMVLINIYKAYFLARPIASLHDNRPPVHFPLSAAAWCVGGAQIAVNEQTPRSCAVAFVFYLFILNFSFDKSMTMRHC